MRCDINEGDAPAIELIKIFAIRNAAGHERQRLGLCQSGAVRPKAHQIGMSVFVMSVSSLELDIIKPLQVLNVGICL